MELFDVEKFGKFDNVFGAVVVDLEDSARGVFAQVHVGGAVEDDLHTCHTGIFGHGFGVDGGHVAIDGGDV